MHPPFLPDTNIVIDALNGKHSRLRQLDALAGVGGPLASTSVVITELYMGVRPNEVAVLERFLATTIYFPVNASCARLAGNLFSKWRRKGHTLELADLTIAAVCIENGLTLVTSNVKHFPMPELRILPLPRLHPTA